MPVFLLTYESRGDVEPMVGLAARLRAFVAGGRVCAPPDFALLLARVSVPLVPLGQPVRPLVAAVVEGCDEGGSGGLLPRGEWR